MRMLVNIKNKINKKVFNVPKLKKDIISTILPNRLGRVSIDVIYHVNADGEFYCVIPEEVVSFFEERKTYNGSVSCSKNRSLKLSIYASTLNELEVILTQALRDVNQPIITKDYVIQYNIESHVSFAETPDGEICANAGYPDAEWRSFDDDNMYGRHYASRQSKGGFSLCVGAKALVKITSKVGEKVTVEYSGYYKDGSHHGHTNPAEKLNSWCSFSLPENCKEIPYTDEAAIFFYDLMYGMAKLSKIIQMNTFDQAALIETITANSFGDNLLSFSSSKSDEEREEKTINS